MTLEARFTAKVGNRDGCWEWTAFVDKAGYGRIGVGNRVDYAHRVSYGLHVGPIPNGYEVDHKCRNRACVNPDHLQAVTRKRNAENLDGANSLNKSSGIRNVYLNNPSGRWYVRVGHAGGSVYGGYFDTLADAEVAAISLRNRLHTNNLKDRATV